MKIFDKKVRNLFVDYAAFKSLPSMPASSLHSQHSPHSQRLRRDEIFSEYKFKFFVTLAIAFFTLFNIINLPGVNTVNNYGDIMSA